jgi:hypothetical protein
MSHCAAVIYGAAVNMMWLSCWQILITLNTSGCALKCVCFLVRFCGYKFFINSVFVHTIEYPPSEIA